MENFFNWVTKPMSKEDVDLWFRVNNLIPEKGELYFDFCYSLFNLMNTTYLGEDTMHNETKVNLTDNDKVKHFEWCWKTTINNFKKENLLFDDQGEHFNYFLTFFMEVYYKQKDDSVKNQISSFLIELFDKEKTFTKSDLDLYTEMYKLLDRSMLKDK